MQTDIDKPRCNCAVVGVYGHPAASVMTYYMLHALQHRGQEAAGITTFFKENDEWKYATHRNSGLVLDIFAAPSIFADKLKGTMAIGHNRYATTGLTNDTNIQPFNTNYKSGQISISHNGNLCNTNTLKRELETKGAIFGTTSDTELFLHLIARSKEKTQTKQILDALRTVRGAYSLAMLTEEGLVAARDPHGVRPLSLGKLKYNIDGQAQTAYVVASETCAFDMIGAEEIRSIRHNEMIIINEETLKTGEIISQNILPATPVAQQCIFEYIYFSRPDSRIFGHNVDKIRRKLGKHLAEEHPITPAKTDAEINCNYNDNDSEEEKNEDKTPKVTVIAVPDSGNTSALGYARANHKQGNESAYEIGLIRSHYVGRTFIQPGQDNRVFKVKSKFNVVKGVIENRNIVVVDDSIVRGTTSKSLIQLIRRAKPSQLHLRITSPPITHPCHYGMDFPSRNELIANHYAAERDIEKELGVDSLRYMSVQKLMESVPHDAGVGYCCACFTGKYPIELEPELEQ